MRAIDKVITSVAAHQGHAITDVKIGSKNLVYTCSEDESVRIWNLNNLAEPIGYKKPKCVNFLVYSGKNVLLRCFIR